MIDKAACSLLLTLALTAAAGCANGTLERDESVVGTWELRDAEGEMVEQMQLTADGAIAIDAGALSVGSYEADGNVMSLVFDWPGGTATYEFTYAATAESLARVALHGWDGDADPAGRYSGSYREITQVANDTPTIVHFDYELELDAGGRAILLVTSNLDATPNALVGSWVLAPGGTIELLGTDGVTLSAELLPGGALGLTGYDAWGNPFGVFKRAR